MAFNPALTLKDKAIAKTVMARLEETGKTYFTSDDLRGWLPQDFFDDPQHEIGAWFARMKWHWYLKRVGEEVSQIESNHKRRVDLWKPTNVMRGWLRSPLLDVYAAGHNPKV